MRKADYVPNSCQCCSCGNLSKLWLYVLIRAYSATEVDHVCWLEARLDYKKLHNICPSDIVLVDRRILS